jgi:hypothetical protein
MFELVGPQTAPACGNSFGSVMIIAHDYRRSPVSRFFHSSQSPTIEDLKVPCLTAIFKAADADQSDVYKC